MPAPIEPAPRAAALFACLPTSAETSPTLGQAGRLEPLWRRQSKGPGSREQGRGAKSRDGGPSQPGTAAPKEAPYVDLPWRARYGVGIISPCDGLRAPGTRRPTASSGGSLASSARGTPLWTWRVHGVVERREALRDPPPPASTSPGRPARLLSKRWPRPGPRPSRARKPAGSAPCPGRLPPGIPRRAGLEAPKAPGRLWTWFRDSTRRPVAKMFKIAHGQG